MNTARPAQVNAAAPQVIGRMDWRIQNRRSTSAKTSSVTRSGCTTETRPLCSASAWKPKAAARATQPKSHSGLRNRYTTSRQPDDRRGSAVLATCWVATLAAFDKAASRANTTAMLATIRGPAPARR